MSSERDIAATSLNTLAGGQYVAPQLRELGDVRDLTLGGTPGSGDSGAVGTENPLNFARAPRR